MAGRGVLEILVAGQRGFRVNDLQARNVSLSGDQTQSKKRELRSIKKEDKALLSLLPVSTNRQNPLNCNIKRMAEEDSHVAPTLALTIFFLGLMQILFRNCSWTADFVSIIFYQNNFKKLP